MLAIGHLSTTVTFIFYAVGLAAFALAAIGFKLPGERVSNLVALGLAAVTFPTFWNLLADL